MRLLAFIIAAILAAVAAPACGSRNEAGVDRHRGPAVSPAAGPTHFGSGDPAHARRRRIVVLGDSLTAGLGLASDEAYPALLQQRVDAEGLLYEVVNAGVSGDTSAGGLRRLDWALEGDVGVLIVALGGNDGLRGLPPDELRRNLAQVIERAQARGIAVVLAGMEAPPNYGPAYAAAFHRVYPSLAKEYHVAFVPFLLQGVAGQVRLNQADGIHPTPQGARIVAGNVWGVLEPILQHNGNAQSNTRGLAPRAHRGAA